MTVSQTVQMARATPRAAAAPVALAGCGSGSSGGSAGDYLVAGMSESLESLAETGSYPSSHEALEIANLDPSVVSFATAAGSGTLCIAITTAKETSSVYSTDPAAVEDGSCDLGRIWG